MTVNGYSGIKVTLCYCNGSSLRIYMKTVVKCCNSFWEIIQIAHMNFLEVLIALAIVFYIELNIDK